MSSESSAPARPTSSARAAPPSARYAATPSTPSPAQRSRLCALTR
ncbi:MAG: hypothetical protein QM820_03910 [Minicystis sp.]